MKEVAGDPCPIEIGPRLADQLELRGISRRGFIQFALGLTAAMGLPFGMSGRVLAAIEETQGRPAVIWLHFQECTGCTESLLRATHPTVESLILDLISLDYSETLLAAAGHQAEQALADSIERNKGRFILVVEGSVPMRDGGIYCKVARKTPRPIRPRRSAFPRRSRVKASPAPTAPPCPSSPCPAVRPHPTTCSRPFSTI